jgi:hypothetical protein
VKSHTKQQRNARLHAATPYKNMAPAQVYSAQRLLLSMVYCVADNMKAQFAKQQVADVNAAMAALFLPSLAAASHKSYHVEVQSQPR